MSTCVCVCEFSNEWHIVIFSFFACDKNAKTARLMNPGEAPIYRRGRDFAGESSP